jgi:hypothetical protein
MIVRILLIVFASLAVLVVCGVIRQAKLTEATRRWEAAGGNVTDSELPLFGPAEVFVNLPTTGRRLEKEPFKVAAIQLFATCSPNLQIRWKGDDNRLVGGDGPLIAELSSMLSGAKVRRIEFLRLDCSEDEMVGFVLANRFLVEVLVPRSAFSDDEVLSMNKQFALPTIRRK